VLGPGLIIAKRCGERGKQDMEHGQEVSKKGCTSCSGRRPLGAVWKLGSAMHGLQGALPPEGLVLVLAENEAWAPVARQTTMFGSDRWESTRAKAQAL